MNKTKLINLDKAVINALDYFIKNTPPKLNLKKYKFPIVTGSGNAYNTGKVLFSKQPAILSNESSFKDIIKSHAPLIKNNTIEEALVISSSGEKDAVWQINLAKERKLKTTLLTCNGESRGAQVADKVIEYSKIPEPYTYNTSTYLGMILSATQEDPKKIKDFIKKLKLPRNFKKYSAYSFILPDEYANIAPMLEIKRNELFGSKLSIRAFSCGEARHAKFVIPNPKELVISLGKNEYYGDKQDRWEIKIPKNTDKALVVSLTYYIIGKIQELKPAYFKNNIETYCQEGPKAYGSKKPFDVIVK